MKTLMQTAKNKGMLSFEAEVLKDNEPTLEMVKKLGFNIELISGKDDVVRAVKDLRQ